MGRTAVRKIGINHIDPLSLLGQNDQNLRLIEGQYPVSITLRDATLSVSGDQEKHVERASQALRDLVVAMLDTQVLLSEKQREQYKKIAAKLPIPKNACGWVMLAQLVKQVDQMDLSLWQRRGFDAIARAGARWER